MNKKGQFIAMVSLFLIIGLLLIYLYLDKQTSMVTRIHYKPVDVLNQNFEIKEILFNLNQEAKYSSFKAFSDFSSNSGFRFGSECKTWYDKDCNIDLENNFKSYFLNYFDEPFYDISVNLVNNNFVISGKYKDKMSFELFDVKTEVVPEFKYTLNYDVRIFNDLFVNCRNVISCDDLKNCKISKCDDSSDDNYIKMEYDLENNGFIKPVILFKITKSKKLEG